MRDGDARQQDELAVSSFLSAGLAELELAAAPERVPPLTDLVLLLDDWSRKINLTGYRDPLGIAGGLVLDAAALLARVPEAQSAQTLADLGSGAGFPGLPISILCPHLEIWLVDSRAKRNHFQREVRRRIGLPRVHPVLGRAEEVEAERCDVVVAQAMAQPERALALMSPWVASEGLLVLPASENASAPAAPPELGQPERREYRVPLTQRRRQLWVYQKTAA